MDLVPVLGVRCSLMNPPSSSLETPPSTVCSPRISAQRWAAFADRIGGDKGGASCRFANGSRRPVSSARVGTGSGKVAHMCGSGGRCGEVLGETGQY